MKMLRLSTLAAVLVLGFGPVAAERLEGTQTYDLLFREGTLDEMPRPVDLTYQRVVQNALAPQLAERDTGDVVLSLEAVDAPLAKIAFQQGDKHRALGAFPASVGNPMIMYFYESVVRDMAETVGGSPFYIRNRVKESLVQSADVAHGEAVVDGKTVETQVVRLAPFEGDPNVARMNGFGALSLVVTMSEAVPGWYVSLVADVPGQDGPLYRSEITFDSVEVAE